MHLDATLGMPVAKNCHFCRRHGMSVHVTHTLIIVVCLLLLFRESSI
jgi:hypothetical protein